LVENYDPFLVTENHVNGGLTLASSAKVRVRQMGTRRGCFIVENGCWLVLLRLGFIIDVDELCLEG